MFKKVKFHENLPLSPGGGGLKTSLWCKPFFAKKIIKLPYSIAISCDFHFFSKYQYLSRFTIYQTSKNSLYNALAKTFFWLLAKLHFKISNLLKIAMNDECTCDLNATSIENVRFWITFEENWKGIPIENNWFLANFKENS